MPSNCTDGVQYRGKGEIVRRSLAASWQLRSNAPKSVHVFGKSADFEHSVGMDDTGFDRAIVGVHGIVDRYGTRYG